MQLWLDLETYSPTPITAGTHRYAEAAEVMLFAWAIDGAPPAVWDLTAGEPCPPALSSALDDPRVELWAHNAAFDRTLLRHALHLAPSLPRWRCNMAQAMCHGLPGSLDHLCTILKVPQDEAKLKEGRQLVHLFCKPRPKNHKLRRATRDTHPEEWSRFVAYAAADITAMRAVNARLPTWNYRGSELALWHLDQTINDRGFAADTDLAQAAIRAVERAQAGLARQVSDATDGAVTAATQRDKLLNYILDAHGVTLPDMRADTLERRLDDPDLPSEVRDLIAIRLQASTSSTAKYAKLLAAASSDGRMRGGLQYSGAQRTRRWAGRLFQPQNMPRPTLDAQTIATGIDAIKVDAADLVTDNVMALASNAIRGCIVAAPGRKIVAADLANIEGRAAAWLAGEKWKLAAFATYDRKEGPDLYCVSYGRAFNVAASSIDKKTLDGYLQRQIGKVMELMLQYEGGVGAFLTGAATYGIDLDDMTARAWDTLPTDVRDEAEGFRKWLVSMRVADWIERHTSEGKAPPKPPPEVVAELTLKAQHGLPARTFVVCDALKRLWRLAHPAIVAYWKALRDAAVLATQNPGQAYRAGRILARRDGAWLRLQLPSGPFLCYPSPDVRGESLTYMGVDQYTRKWSRLSTYGGKLFENACQALSRDVLASSMPRIEAAGFPLVLTVHDEVITEPDDSPEFSAVRLAGLMAIPPAWAEGLPLAAEGFEAERYRKE